MSTIITSRSTSAPGEVLQAHTRASQAQPGPCRSRVLSTSPSCSVVRRPGPRASAPARLAIGLVALALMLLTEFTAVLWIRGLTIDQYPASRDPVAGSVYIAMLGVFAFMPLLVARR